MISGEGQKESVFIRAARAGWDGKGAADRFLHDEELFLRSVHDFLHDKVFDELKNAITVRDIDQVFRTAHYLKGSAVMVGNRELGEILQQITELTREREPGSADLTAELLPFLENSLEKAKKQEAQMRLL